MSPNVDSLNAWQRVRLVWNLMRDDRVGSWVKRLGPAAIIAYVVSPIDVIPDFLFGPGQVDDLGVITIGLVILSRLLVQFAPSDVVAEHIARITGTWSQQRDQSARPSGHTGPTIDTSGRVR